MIPTYIIIKKHTQCLDVSSAILIQNFGIHKPHIVFVAFTNGRRDMTNVSDCLTKARNFLLQK